MEMRRGVPLENVTLRAPFGETFVDVDRLSFGSAFRTVHGSSHSHGDGNEILHLLGVPIVLSEVVVYYAHFLLGATGKVGNEIRNHKLAFPRFFIDPVENFTELVKLFRLSFPHQTQHSSIEMLRCDADLSLYMVTDDLFGLLGLRQCKIQPHTGVDVEMLHARDLFNLVNQIHQRFFIRMIVRTEGGEKTRVATAFFAAFRVFGTMSVNVSGCATDIADGSAEERLLHQMLDAADHTGGRTGDDASSLVNDQTTKSASAWTAANNGDGVFDHLICGNFFSVAPMRTQGIG